MGKAFLLLGAAFAALLLAGSAAAGTPSIVGTHTVAEATSGSGAEVDPVPVYTDSDTTATVTGSSCTPALDHVFPIGTTSMTCSVTFSNGDKATSSFNVTVVDSTPPAFTNVPASNAQIHEAIGPSGAVATFVAPTATDLVDGVRSTTCSPASGSTFALGTTTVTCTASDTRGNAASTTFTVSVFDTLPPTLKLPGDQTAEATSSAGATVTYAATATDTVSGAVTPSCSPASGSTFALGATTVTCTAADARGNRATGSFTVTVKDTTAPTITAPGTVKATAAKGKKTAAVKFTASASDAVSGAVQTTCKPSSGSAFKVGTTKVSCSAADAAGNTATQTIAVVVSRKK